MGYTKLFDSMWSGSLYGKFEASAVFMVMLSLSDAEGQVDMTHEAIAGRTGWPLDFIREGITQLEAPDPRSRTGDAQGRRIIRLDDNREWGWFITNHAKYRDEMRSIERREYLREAKRKERDKRRQQLSTSQPPSTPHMHMQNHMQKQGGEAEGSQARPAKPPPRKRCPQEFEITDGLREWAKVSAPDVDLLTETEKFRDWEFKTGRSDWAASWRTWMRRAQETAKPNKTNGAAHSPAVDAWNELLASDGAKRDGVVQQVLQQIGGWQRIRMRTDFDAERIRKEFCKTYDEVSA